MSYKAHRPRRSAKLPIISSFCNFRSYYLDIGKYGSIICWVHLTTAILRVVTVGMREGKGDPDSLGYGGGQGGLI